MAFLPKSCVVERYRENVSNGAVSYQHQNSVSGTLRISDMVAPRKIPPGRRLAKVLIPRLIPNH